jgi:hypothetical protein
LFDIRALTLSLISRLDFAATLQACRLPKAKFLSNGPLAAPRAPRLAVHLNTVAATRWLAAVDQAELSGCR